MRLEHHSLMKRHHLGPTAKAIAFVAVGSPPTLQEPTSFVSALPIALADLALIDAKACAAVADMSVSWWLEKVASGQAPQPAIRMPRCTRWRLADVAAFWRDFGNKADDGAADAMKAQATRASSKARTPEAIAKAKATRAANIAARRMGA